MTRSTVALVLVALLCAAIPVRGGNAGANGTVALGASFFNKLFKAGIPLMEQVGPTVTLGPFDGDHYNVGTFKLTKLEIGSIQVAFNKPDVLEASMAGLQVGLPTTPFYVFEEVFGHKFGCHGTFSGSTTGPMTGYMTIALQAGPKGKIEASVGLPTVSVSSITMDVSMNGVCKVASGLISVFKSTVEKLVASEIEKMMPLKIQGLVQNMTKKVLPKIPLHFASQPAVQDNTMELDLQLIPPMNNTITATTSEAVVRKPGPPTAHVKPHIFTDRDFSIGMNTLSFNDIVAHAAATNGFNFVHQFSGKVNTSIFEWFIPKAYERCPGCPFNLGFHILPNSPPKVTFGQEALQFDFMDAQINFTALDNTTGASENLFSVLTNLSFGVTNFTVEDQGDTTLIKFQLALNNFSMRLGYSFLGPISLTKFNKFVNQVLVNLLLPAFNKGFNGFPLNLDKDGFGLYRWKVDLNQDALSLGANLLLPGERGIAGAIMRGKL